ncbi:hypothetical protein COCON_G00165420 [Conger conger]|uniref:Uncharacterized protein n=1 Tax=Conger conger TaxID=82655 RepID=A0A9Q1D7K1_CONCO|nr:hypothetical protein COCON_G00165420 [Conger conger]
MKASRLRLRAVTQLFLRVSDSLPRRVLCAIVRRAPLSGAAMHSDNAGVEKGGEGQNSNRCEVSETFRADVVRKVMNEDLMLRLL